MLMETIAAVSEEPPTMSTSRRWAAIPAARSSMPVLKVKLWLVLGTLFFSAAMGIISIVIVLAGTSAPAPVTTGPSTANQAFAETVAYDFLAGRSTQVAVATGVDRNFGRGTDVITAQAVESVIPVSVDYQTVNGLPVELYRFAAVLTGGRTLQVTVPVQPTTIGPVLLAAPAVFAPQSYAADDVVDAFDYTQLLAANSGSPSPNTTAVVDQWAQAYAAGDSATLQRDVVGDPDPNGVYVGVGGLTASEVKVISWFPRDETGQYVSLRVSVLLSSTGAEKWTVRSEFDLLVKDPTSATPKVQAWGPVGSGPTLTAFQNNRNPSPQR